MVVSSCYEQLCHDGMLLSPCMSCCCLPCLIPSSHCPHTVPTPPHPIITVPTPPHLIITLSPLPHPIITVPAPPHPIITLFPLPHLIITLLPLPHLIITLSHSISSHHHCPRSTSSHHHTVPTPSHPIITLFPLHLIPIITLTNLSPSSFPFPPIRSVDMPFRESTRNSSRNYLLLYLKITYQSK